MNEVDRLNVGDDEEGSEEVEEEGEHERKVTGVALR